MANPLHSNEEIDRIKGLLLKEADSFGTKTRFGYFSIPYPITVGDRYYATKSKSPSRDANGKVQISPRNMVMKIPKSGKGYDVYFSNPFKEEVSNVNRIKQAEERDHKKYIEGIKEKKSEKKFHMTFKPSGPQEMGDFFSINPYQNKNPLYKDPQKHYAIDKQTRKVVIENRNMKMAAPKKGFSGYPDICFSYPKSEKPKKGARAKTCTAHRKNDKKFNQPFRPANIALNSYFYNDKKQFSYPDQLNKSLEDEFKRSKSAGTKKFKKSKKETYATHIREFFPSSPMKVGEKGYFSQRYGVPFVPYKAKTRAQTSKDKKFSQAFK